MLPRPLPGFACACAAFVALAAPGLVRTADAGAGLPTGFEDVTIVGGLDMPVSMAFVPDRGERAGHRLLIVEQNTARVRLVVDDHLAAIDPVGTVPDVRTDFWERGLLGIAVDPRWPSSPYLYLHFTAVDSFVHLVRYRAVGDLAWDSTGAFALDPASRYEVIADVPDQHPEHNGGTLRFEADSLLDESFGDDHDWCEAQDTTSLLGKIVRIDVRGIPDGPGGPAPKGLLAPPDNPFASYPDSNARLVAVLGLRNPFRFQIDPVSGALLIGDVGENDWEELDRVRPGANCGWPLYEGFELGISCGPNGSALAFPIYTYDHSQGVAVMALGVCRPSPGQPFPFPDDYAGDLFVADYFGGWIRRLSRDDGDWALEPADGQPGVLDWASNVANLSDAQFAPDGALWYLLQSQLNQSVSGTIHAIRALPAPSAVPLRADAFGLGAPWPNPGRGPFALAFTLPHPGAASLVVHDLVGRVVRVLADGPLAAGGHRVTWDGRDARGRPVATGLYWATLNAEGASTTRRIVLAR